MKRLLAYLFLVLGFVLFNNNLAEAKGLQICKKMYQGREAGVHKFKDRPKIKRSWCKTLYYSNNPGLYDAISSRLRLTGHGRPTPYYINDNVYDRLVSQFPAQTSQTTSTTTSTTTSNYSGFACVYPVRTTAQYSTRITYKGESTFSVVMDNYFAKNCPPGSHFLILKSVHPSQYANLKEYAGKNISRKALLDIITGTSLHKYISSYISTYEKTQIAKKEPSQTQKGLDLLKQQVVWTVWVKHADKDYKSQRPYTGRSDYVIYDIEKSKYLINPKSPKEEAIFIAKDKCRKDNPNNPDGCLIDKINELTRKPKKTSSNDRPTETKSYYKQELKNYLAKTEPSQTQEVDQSHSHLIKPGTWVYFVRITKKEFLNVSKFDASNFLNNKKNMNNYKFDTTDNLFKYQRNIRGSLKTEIRISKKLHDTLFDKNSGILTGEGGMGFLDTSKEKKNYLKLIFNTIEDYKPKILKDLIDEYTEDNELKEGLLAYFDDEKPTIKPKKKKKVKVAQKPKEEFKPEDKDIDNDPPVIEIAEAITVDSQAYTLKGKVKDKSKIYLTIDGRQVQVKKGKFKVDRFNIDPDEVEEIKIVAIDKWNNKTEKTIKVTIDLKSTELARSFEDLKPNSVRVKTDKNKIAIIIGIEKYANLINLDAKYANRDAKAFRTYATKALGVKESNIKILVDDKATRSQTLKAFKLWLPRIAGDGGKDIHIFFAGHGLASDDGEDLYILPQDGESSLLEDTAISRVELISLVQKVNPKSVTMFFDTCYSGQTRDERMLVASLRPIRIVADEQDTPNNFTIFTASNYDQTSGSIEEAKHGMFSYYLMKGLEGKADNNKDKKITNGELIAYLKTNVGKEAFTQNREQDPMLSGDPDKVLMSYR